ncbi:MAG: TonB-dependent receptor [Mangrovibacterium sp.]
MKKKWEMRNSSYRNYAAKLMRIMKITAFFLLSFALHLSANVYSQQTRLKVDFNQATIKDVMAEIERQTGLTFFYSPDILNTSQTVTVTSRSMSLEDILMLVSRQTGLSVELIRDQVVVEKKDATEQKANSQQPRSVTGKVTDVSGTALPGVTVAVKGSSSGTITGNDGSFSLSALPSDGVLVFSFVGMKTLEISTEGKNMIEVVMEEETLGIEEVVAIGYGTQRKRDLTGAVSTVKAEDLSKIPVAGIDQALQGQVAGVMVTQNYGSPGAGMQVRIRGIGTISDSDPLYVIDGVPTKEYINTLNTADIESISVLKDASAAAIYGARAANGVVLITTKKGKSGVTQVNLDAQYGVQNISNKLDLLSAKEYAEICNEALVNDGKQAVWNPSALGDGTDWQDAIFRNAAFQKYDVSVNSGREKSQFMFGIGYYGQDGIVEFSDFKRYNIRFNLNSKVSDRLTVGTNLNLSRVSENLIDTEINGVVRAAIFQPPTIPVYNNDGTYAGPGVNEGDAQNPLGMAERSDMTLKQNQVFGNLFAEYTLLPGLKLKSSLGLNVYAKQNKNFDPTFSEGNANRTINTLSQNNVNYYDVIWENTLSYTKEIGGKHLVSALIGNSLQESESDELSGYREGFTSNDGYLQYLNAGSSNDKSRSNLYEWSLASFYGRLNYSFSDKYLLSGNIRVDGSSRFGKSNRWGVFPSASAGWRISSEPFFNVPFIDDLKLRASWGQLGNQDIGLYAFSSTLSQTFYALGTSQSLHVGYAPSSDYNPDVKWETTTQQDLGVDLSAYNSRLFVSADYYIKKTTDMLLILPQPMTSGFGTTGYENLGEVENKGLELQLSWKDRVGENFSYTISANLATLQNKVTSLGDIGQPITSGLFFDMSTRTEEGHAIREFYGYVTDGIFQNQAEVDEHVTQAGARPGDIRFKNLNNDEVIDSKDRTFIGNPYPDFFYGFTAGIGWKNFDLSCLLQGQTGNDIYNGTKFWLTNSGYNYNKGKDILGRWTGQGTSNSEPRLTTADPNQNSRGSDRYIESGSYLRLKNIQIGYTLPDYLLKRWGISNARIYFSGLNLLTFTDYSGYDPEVGAARTGDRTIGFDEVTYPQNKSYILGINLSF